jgi:YidC/Oxa1 family membrane protein insertase
MLIANFISDFLSPLIDACNAILQFWYDLLGSWGLSIIFLTFTVRLAILPLAFKGVKGMNRLQYLQPEMKRIQERYKDDKQRQQQELMKFYQEQKVNPLGSCLPLVLQFPFFMALFYLLGPSGDGSFAKECCQPPNDGSFLFIPNLAEKLTGHPVQLVVMIVLYVGTQLISTAVSTVSADPTQRKIMFALPFVFTAVVINFPAGLLVYWITTNTWTIGQQLVVRKLYPKPEPIQPSDDDKPSPARGKPRAEKKADDDGKPDAKKEKQPASRKRAATAKATSGGNGAGGNGAKTSKPPASPRKKRKRSGRRR